MAGCINSPNTDLPASAHCSDFTSSPLHPPRLQEVAGERILLFSSECIFSIDSGLDPQDLLIVLFIRFVLLVLLLHLLFPTTFYRQSPVQSNRNALLRQLQRLVQQWTHKGTNPYRIVGINCGNTNIVGRYGSAETKEYCGVRSDSKSLSGGRIFLMPFHNETYLHAKALQVLLACIEWKEGGGCRSLSNLLIRVIIIIISIRNVGAFWEPYN